MASLSMFDVSELAGFPGEFTQEMVDAAVASIRGDAGWHIAPVVTETVVVYANGTRFLPLPSLRVLSVGSVVVAGQPSVGWLVQEGGILFHPFGWLYGPVTVTFTHGYESAPDLLPEVVSRCSRFSRDQSILTQTDGPFSTTYSNTMEQAGPSSVSRYTIPALA